MHDAELRQLKAQREALLARQQAIGSAPRVPEIGSAEVDEYRRRVLAIFANGTSEEENYAAKARCGG